MGSYENIIKIEEMRKKLEEGDLETAQKILDTMDRKKVKNILDLNLMAEVYEGNGKYEEAKEIYLKIYERTRTRKALFNLLNIIIKLNDLEEATYFYQVYERLAPDDFYNYIFRYYIEKLKGADYESLIGILEELKKHEYIEKWAYELAKLYYKAGMEAECIRECSDIILWFGEGPYVEKARLLRSYFMGEADKEKIMQEIKRRAELKGSQADYAAKEYAGEDSADDERGWDKEAYTDNLYEANAYNENKYKSNTYEEYESQDMLSEDFEYGLSQVVRNYMDEPSDSEDGGYYDSSQEMYDYDYSYDHTGVDDEQSATAYEGQMQDMQSDADSGAADEYLQSFYADENQYDGESENVYDLFSWLESQYGFAAADFFAPYLQDEESSEQVQRGLEDILMDESNNVLMLIGGSGASDKTGLAKKLAIFLNITGRLKSQKLAKINAEKLNLVDIFTKKDLIKDCCLLIEDASLLTESTLERVLELSNQLPGALPVIFEEDNARISKLFEEHPVLMDLLQIRIYLH